LYSLFNVYFIEQMNNLMRAVPHTLAYSSVITRVLNVLYIQHLDNYCVVNQSLAPHRSIVLISLIRNRTAREYEYLIHTFVTHTYTHTHTHTHTLARMLAHIQTHACMHTCAHTPTCTHTRAHTQTRTQMHTHT